MAASIKVVIAFLILALFFWIIEWLWPEDRTQAKWRRDSFTDLLYWLFNGLITRLLVTIVAVVAVIVAMLALPHLEPGFIGGLPGWLQVLGVLLIGDFIGYWTHRLSHIVPALWRLHAIHHSSEKLDWLAAGRVHPFDTLFHRVAAVVPLYLLGFNPGVLAIYAPFLAIYPIFLHANLSWNFGPLGYIIASPGFHRWHHSADKEALDKNFSGAFPFFDYLFGTAYFPRHRKPQKYGLYQEQIPQGLWPQLVYPFRKKSGPPFQRTNWSQ